MSFLNLQNQTNTERAVAFGGIPTPSEVEQPEVANREDDVHVIVFMGKPYPSTNPDTDEIMFGKTTHRNLPHRIGTFRHQNRGFNLTCLGVMKFDSKGDAERTCQMLRLLLEWRKMGRTYRYDACRSLLETISKITMPLDEFLMQHPR